MARRDVAFIRLNLASAHIERLQQIDGTYLVRSTNLEGRIQSEQLCKDLTESIEVFKNYIGMAVTRMLNAVAG